MQALWGKADVKKKYSYLHYPSMAGGQIAEISLESVPLVSVASLFLPWEEESMLKIYH